MRNEIITDEDRYLSQIMKALANPVRIAIIRRLVSMNQEAVCNCGEDCCGINCKCGCKCGELVELLPMSQSTVSQHLKELKSAGLIDMNGRKGDYTLNHSKLSEGVIMLLNLLGKSNKKEMENNTCNCGPNCQCGENCNCGPDCQCGSGGECTCGPECNCK